MSYTSICLNDTSFQQSMLECLIICTSKVIKLTKVLMKHSTHNLWKSANNTTIREGSCNIHLLYIYLVASSDKCQHSPTLQWNDILFVFSTGIPEEVRLQALQAIMLLLPDENREALQCFLYFLKYVASQKHSHQVSVSLSNCK